MLRRQGDLSTRSNLKRTARTIYTNHKRSISTAAIGVMLTTLIASVPLRAFADGSTVLMDRVNRALRANDNLNGAMCCSPAPGVIVLYSKVFDTRDSCASNVRSVAQVVNALRTETGQWMAEEERINDTLLLNGLEGVSARVIGSQVYLAGTVASEAEKQRASIVVALISNLQRNNLNLG